MESLGIEMELKRGDKVLWLDDIDSRIDRPQDVTIFILNCDTDIGWATVTDKCIVHIYSVHNPKIQRDVPLNRIIRADDKQALYTYLELKITHFITAIQGAL